MIRNGRKVLTHCKKKENLTQNPIYLNRDYVELIATVDAARPKIAKRCVYTKNLWRKYLLNWKLDLFSLQHRIEFQMQISILLDWGCGMASFHFPNRAGNDNDDAEDDDATSIVMRKQRQLSSEICRRCNVAVAFNHPYFLVFFPPKVVYRILAFLLVQ